MKNFLFLLLGWVVLVFSAEARADTVDLKKAEKVALERNLQLRAETYNTLATEALVRRGYGIYDPLLQATAAVGESRNRVNLAFLSDTTTDILKFRTLNLSLIQLVPSGGALSVDFLNRREGSNSTARLFDPAYTGELKFSIVQPLLQGYGRTVTEQGILFAIKDREAAVQDLRAQAFLLISRVRDAYFDVLRFRDNLAYRETSVNLAARVFEENQARVKAGVLPPVEVLEAEVGLKTRERELLDAEREYRDSLDNLAVLLNISGDLEVVQEALQAPDVHVDEDLGYRYALEKRPDLLRRLKEIERLRLEGEIARNRLLPALDLTASYSHSGLSEEIDEELEDLTSSRFRDWEIGLILSYPLGNRDARYELQRSRLQLRGRQALLGQLQEEIRSEIRAAIRLLEVNRKKIEVASRGKDLAEEKLRMLFKRKEVGLATTRQVLEGEEDLARARTDEIAALADYNNAVTEYLQVTGLLLEHEGIRISGPLDLKEEEPLLKMN